MPRFTVLIVDDEKTLARSIKLFLDAHGYEAEVAEDGDAALELLEKLHPDLVFLDLRLPKTTGLELLKKIREYDPHIAVVLLTAYGTIEGAVEAMKLGALDYLKKPIDLEELRIVADRAQEASRLRQEVKYYRERDARDFELEGLIGRCPTMQRIFAQVKHLASLEEEAPTVLLTGETGTGKSLVARALHVQSRRAGHPFIEIDCTSLPPTLIESELFGYEKGARVEGGADRGRRRRHGVPRRGGRPGAVAPGQAPARHRGADGPADRQRAGPQGERLAPGRDQ